MNMSDKVQKQSECSQSQRFSPAGLSNCHAASVNSRTWLSLWGPVQHIVVEPATSRAMDGSQSPSCSAAQRQMRHSIRQLTATTSASFSMLSVQSLSFSLLQPSMHQWSFCRARGSCVKRWLLEWSCAWSGSRDGYVDQQSQITAYAASQQLLEHQNRLARCQDMLCIHHSCGMALPVAEHVQDCIGLHGYEASS